MFLPAKSALIALSFFRTSSSVSLTHKYRSRYFSKEFFGDFFNIEGLLNLLEGGIAGVILKNRHQTALRRVAGFLNSYKK